MPLQFLETLLDLIVAGRVRRGGGHVTLQVTNFRRAVFFRRRHVRHPVINHIRLAGHELARRAIILLGGGNLLQLHFRDRADEQRGRVGRLQLQKAIHGGNGPLKGLEQDLHLRLLHQRFQDRPVRAGGFMAGGQ